MRRVTMKEEDEGGQWQVQRSKDSRRARNVRESHTETQEELKVMKWMEFEKGTHTVFVDNLPRDIARRTLFRIFTWVGSVVDVYVSRKRRLRSDSPFAFIRYDTKGGAMRAVERLDGVYIGITRMVVKVARFRRNQEKTRDQEVQAYPETRNQKSLREEDIGDTRYNEKRESLVMVEPESVMAVEDEACSKENERREKERGFMWDPIIDELIIKRSEVGYKVVEDEKREKERGFLWDPIIDELIFKRSEVGNTDIGNYGWGGDMTFSESIHILKMSGSREPMRNESDNLSIENGLDVDRAQRNKLNGMGNHTLGGSEKQEALVGLRETLIHNNIGGKDQAYDGQVGEFSYGSIGSCPYPPGFGPCASTEHVHRVTQYVNGPYVSEGHYGNDSETKECSPTREKDRSSEKAMREAISTLHLCEEAGMRFEESEVEQVLESLEKLGTSTKIRYNLRSRQTVKM